MISRGNFSLPRIYDYIAFLKRSTFSVSIRLFYNNFIVTRNVDDFKSHIYACFVGSENSEGKIMEKIVK